MIGKIKRYRRIFTKASLKSRRILGVCEDGSREWITMLATICADGTYGRPLLIYPSEASALQDTWLSAVDPTQQDVAFSATASGWTNDELGLQWLDDFDKWSRAKLAKPSHYRLLILDGHGSHTSIKFFTKCHQERIILAVFPPHATHRLQPLDIGIFRPFAMKYSLQLDQWRNDRLGMSRFTKREFFHIFWPSYVQSFTAKNILSAWEKSGLFPRDAAKIVNVVDQPANTSRPGTAHSGSSTVSIHAYIRVRKRVRFALRGISDEAACMVGEFLDGYQVALAIAEHERDCYKRAAETEKARRQRSKPLATKEFEGKHGKVLVWTPQYMVLKEEHEAALLAQQAAAELAKQEAKELKQREKEDREVLTAQRKALAADNALQKKIAREMERAEKLQSKQAQKEASAQLKNDSKATQKAHNTKQKKIATKKQLQEAQVVIDDDNNGGLSKSTSTTRTRTVKPRQRFDELVFN